MDRFDRFTERARKVLTLAREEAQRLNHDPVGAEHLLLGLVRERNGIAARVLARLGVELDGVRSAVELVTDRPEHPVVGETDLTPRARKAIELAHDEARRLNHQYIGTEHLLLGLVREGEGPGGGVLASLGVSAGRVRTEVDGVLTGSSRWTRPTQTPTIDWPSVDQSAYGPALREASRELEAVLRQKEAAITDRRYELAAELRDREVELRETIERLLASANDEHDVV